MKRFYLLIPIFLLLLTACGGGGSAVSDGATVPTSTAFRSPLEASSSITETQSDAIQSTQPQWANGSNDLLYVGNVGNNSITVYHYNDSFNAAPIRVIAGSKTGIQDPGQLSEDAEGNLYVANSAGGYDAPDPSAAILVFKHGANGNVAPIRRLAGPKTGIHLVEGMTVDRTTGKLFLFDNTTLPQDQGATSLLRFPPNASGNAAPFARSPTEFNPAPEIASDSTGKNLIVAKGFYSSNTTLGVQTSAKQFPNNADPANVYGVSGFAPNGVADDPTTKTYLATGVANGLTAPGPFGIYRFAERTNGSFPFNGQPNQLAPPLVSVITSDTCGGQLAVGYLRAIYVVHTKNPCPEDAVYVYAHDSSGNVAPLRILKGPATKLDQPYGIYEGR